MPTREAVSEYVWVDIRSPQEVPTRLRRQVEEAFIACWENPECRDALTADGEISLVTRQMLTELSDLSILALVDQWSFGDVDRDVLLDMPSVCAQWVAQCCAAHAPGLIPQLGLMADAMTPPKKVANVRGRATNQRTPQMSGRG